MFDSPILYKALIALLLGLLLGAGQEKVQIDKKERDIAGIRSFTILSLLGYFAALIQNFKIMNFVIIISIGIIFLIIAGYTYEAFMNKRKGITSELGAILTFIIGVLTFYEPTFAIIIAIVLTIILTFKLHIHAFIGKIKMDEYYATIKFAVIAFVVLPILPNYALDPWGIVNLSNIWLMVAFISGISFLGYILTKGIGVTKGIGITGLVGGLVSSTAVTTSMATQSNKNKKIVFPFVLAVQAASVMMFGRVLIVIGVLNYELLPFVAVSFGIMIFVNIVVAIIFWLITSKTKIKFHEVSLSSPFQFMPALKFGVFFLFILFVIELARRYLGESGFYITALISGFADVDAINISMSQLSDKDPAYLQIAARTITLAVIANTFVKGAIAVLFGGKAFGKYIAISFLAVIISGIVGVLIV